MKKILLLFIIISSFAFGEWKTYEIGEFRTIEFEENFRITYYKNEIIGSSIVVEDKKEFERISHTFNEDYGPANNLPFIANVYVEFKIDDNEELLFKTYPKGKYDNRVINLDLYYKKNMKIEETEKIQLLIEQMKKGKTLKIIIHKGKNKIEKKYELEVVNNKNMKVNSTYNDIKKEKLEKDIKRLEEEEIVLGRKNKGFGVQEIVTIKELEANPSGNEMQKLKDKGLQCVGLTQSKIMELSKMRNQLKKMEEL